MMERVNSTMIYCKNVCKATMYPQHNNLKNQHPFIIKALEKLGKEGSYLNILKVIYNKLTANIILNEEN
jgi:hypothetical protein